LLIASYKAINVGFKGVDFVIVVKNIHESLFGAIDGQRDEIICLKGS